MKKKRPVCAIEVTDEQEMYVVLDGQRIARRNNKRNRTLSRHIGAIGFDRTALCDILANMKVFWVGVGSL